MTIPARPKDPLYRPTHWEDCYLVHNACALARIERLERELECQQELIAEASSVISLARTQYEAMSDRTLNQDELLVAMCDFEDSMDKLGEGEGGR